MNEIVKYDWNGEQITLTPDDVRKYISTDERVTDKEVFLFLKLCQAQKLNPFVREAYLIKYGSAAAQMVVGKETFLKRAEANEDFDGYDITEKGKVPEYSVTCKVYRKKLKHPITVTVDYSEYVGTNAKGEINRMWKGKPKTMLRKVALMQGLREAFPTALGGLYEETELQQQVKPVIDITEEEIPETDEDKKLRKETDYVEKGKEAENEIESVDSNEDKELIKKVNARQPETDESQTKSEKKWKDYPISPAQREKAATYNIDISKCKHYADVSKLIRDSVAKSKKKLTRGDGQSALIPEEE